MAQRLALVLKTAPTRNALRDSARASRIIARQAAEVGAREMIAQLDRRIQRKSAAKQIERSLKAVFIPVELKGRRKVSTVFGHPAPREIYVPTKEFWPNLEAIYRARILNHNKTYRGRKRFHVDVNKLEALEAKLIARAALAPPHRYKLRMRQTSTGFVAEVVQIGGRPGRRRSKAEHDAVVVASSKFRKFCEANLSGALKRLGL